MSIEYSKPSLVNEKIKAKISNILNPPETYVWDPAIDVVNNILDKYIKPNWFYVILFIVFIITLFYRYIQTKERKFKEKILYHDNQYYNSVNNENIRSNILEEYNRQKELSREPIKKDKLDMPIYSKYGSL